MSSSVEYLSAYLYSSSIVVGGSKDSEWKNGVVRPRTSSKILEDRIHTVQIKMFDGPSKSSDEIVDGLNYPKKKIMDGLVLSLKVGF